ncbi:MAG: hypothetical protein AAF581_17140 [Planctomycetota bacterium]
MKILGLIGKGYCVAAGLLVAPIAIGILIAHFSGMLPEQPLQRIVQALEKEDTGENGEEAPVDEPVDEVQDRTASDERSWSRRLEQVGDGILANLKDVEAARAKVARQEQELQELVQSLTGVLSTLFEEPVTEEQLFASADQLVDRLRSMGKSENRMPWMLDTLKSMKPRAVAGLRGTAGCEE